MGSVSNWGMILRLWDQRARGGQGSQRTSWDCHRLKRGINGWGALLHHDPYANVFLGWLWSDLEACRFGLRKVLTFGARNVMFDASTLNTCKIWTSFAPLHARQPSREQRARTSKRPFPWDRVLMWFWATRHCSWFCNSSHFRRIFAHSYIRKGFLPIIF